MKEVIQNDETKEPFARLGPAASLLTRNMICVRPIGGWWRNRGDVTVCERKTRYALIVSIMTDDTEVDLHTAIETLVQNQVGIETGLG